MNPPSWILCLNYERAGNIRRRTPVCTLENAWRERLRQMLFKQMHAGLSVGYIGWVTLMLVSLPLLTPKGYCSPKTRVLEFSRMKRLHWRIFVLLFSIFKILWYSSDCLFRFLFLLYRNFIFEQSFFFLISTIYCYILEIEGAINKICK